MGQMKKFFLIINLLFISNFCFASSSYTSNNGTLVISNLSVDGETNYSKATIQLDIANGTFKILDLTPKALTISQTPLNTFEQQGLKFDFFGCSRSGLNQVSCHIDITNNQNDRNVGISPGINASLFGNHGRLYRSIVTALGETSDGVNPLFPLLIRSIPVRVVYIYNNINIHTTSFAAFLPSFFISDSNLTIQGDFRNISF